MEYLTIKFYGCSKLKVPLIFADACFYSPAMVPRTIVVGNVEADDTINKYSNYGECVDIFAPGASIRSASSTSNTLEA